MPIQPLTNFLLVAVVVVMGSSARADTEAESLLREIVTANNSLRALQADLSIEGVTGSNKTALQYTGACTLKRLDKWRFEVEGGLDMPGGKPRKYLLVSNGATSWKVSAQSGWYTCSPVKQKGTVMVPADPLSRFFYSGEGWLKQSQGTKPEAAMLPSARIDGVVCRGVQVSTRGIDTARQVQLFVGPDLVVRRIRESRYGGGADWIQVTLKNVKTNAAVPDRTFAYDALPGMRLSRQPVESQSWLSGFLLEEWTEARQENGILEEEWAKLAGVWAGPFRTSPNMARHRYIVRLEQVGRDHHFEQYDETVGADGKSEANVIHSAVLLVTQAR